MSRIDCRLQICVAALAALLCGGLSTTDAATTEHPNIVLIMVDDVGWLDISANQRLLNLEPNWRCKTPQIDKLAAHGVLFTNARAAGVCSPTRVSVMTGQNPARHRVTTWTCDLNRPPPDGNGPILMAPTDWNFNSLQPEGSSITHSVEAPTLAQVLRTAGYWTIHVGKAHWGAIGSPGASPEKLGFAVSIAGSGYGGVGSYLGVDHYRGKEAGRDIPGLERYYVTDTFLTDALAQEAIRLLREAVVGGKPFFLHLSHYAVHAPLMADPRFYDNEKQRGLSDTQAKYASLIRGIDQSVGQVLDELTSLQVADNTIVIFLSDNGGLKHDGVDNAPLRGEKGTGFDGGLRVPMIVRWPGITPPGTTCDANVVAEDLYPTLIAAAGAEFPSAYRPKVDGKNLTQLLAQRPGFAPDRPVFFHQPHYHRGRPYSAIIVETWKLIAWHEDADLDLYDLSTDIAESNDLAADEPVRSHAMLDTLVGFLQQVDAQLPSKRISGRRLQFADLVNRAAQ